VDTTLSIPCDVSLFGFPEQVGAVGTQRVVVPIVDGEDDLIDEGGEMELVETASFLVKKSGKSPLLELKDGATVRFLSLHCGDESNICVLVRTRAVNGHASISDCSISCDRADDGIFVSRRSRVEIERCKITKFRRAGVRLEADCFASLCDCTLEGNMCNVSCTPGSSSTISNTRMHDHTGLASFIANGSTVTADGCVFSGGPNTLLSIGDNCSIHICNSFLSDCIGGLGVEIHDSRVLIDACMFNDLSCCLQATGKSRVDVSHSSLSHVRGDAVRVLQGSSLFGNQCDINMIEGSGIVVDGCGECEVSMEDSSIEGCNGNGIIVGRRQGGHLSLERCEVMRNTLGGIHVSSKGSASIARSVFNVNEVAGVIVEGRSFLHMCVFLGRSSRSLVFIGDFYGSVMECLFTAEEQSDNGEVIFIKASSPSASIEVNRCVFSEEYQAPRLRVAEDATVADFVDINLVPHDDFRSAPFGVSVAVKSSGRKKKPN
jgi:hypothetical protein